MPIGQHIIVHQMDTPAEESATAAKATAAPPVKSRSVFRSAKLYLPLLTSFILVGLFALYSFLYVSSQETYYHERAFRVLSELGDKVLEKIAVIQTVLAASLNPTIGGTEKANKYVSTRLKS